MTGSNQFFSCPHIEDCYADVSGTAVHAMEALEGCTERRMRCRSKVHQIATQGHCQVVRHRILLKSHWCITGYKYADSKYASAMSA
eukprot:scaffold11219_cov22-Tisochrysis_lutea.AAC.4